MISSDDDTIEKLRAAIAVEQARVAEAHAERDLAVAKQKTAEAERDAYWVQICDTMAALGRCVPETAPHSVSWARKTCTAYSKALADLGDVRVALADLMGTFEVHERPPLTTRERGALEAARVVLLATT